MTADVLVVGGGPAGAAAALALRQAGVEAVVLERFHLPRRKCCSGVLFGEAQRVLEELFGGLPPAEVRCRPEFIAAEDIRAYEEGRWETWRWEVVQEGLPGRYVNVWRSLFDRWLLERSGARVLDGHWLVGLTQEAEGVVVRVRVGNEVRELRARYLIAADGGSSRVRRLLRGELEGGLREVVVYQEYRICERIDLERTRWYVFLRPHFGDIFSSLHFKDELAVLCVGTARVHRPGPCLDAFRTFLGERFGASFGERRWAESCLLNDMFLRPEVFLGTGRVLVTGEAAGFLGLNGEGIAEALRSGHLAGQAVAEALRRPADPLSLYRKATQELQDRLWQLVGQHRLLL